MVVPVLQTNYSFLIPHDGGCVVVDPPVVQPIQDAAGERDWALTAILLTHHHPDHIGGAEELAALHDCPVYGPGDARIPMVTHVVGEGDTVRFGTSLSAQVWEVPGHTSSHIAYYLPESNALFCGDLLFSGGCGRIFDGTARQMWNSIERLDSLPGETLIFCGHEYTESNLEFAATVEPDNPDLAAYASEVKEMRRENRPTIPCLLERERLINPFMRAADPAVIRGSGSSADDPSSVFEALRNAKDHF